MDLMPALSRGMTWRRFQALLRGLGPNSALVNQYNAKQTDRQGKPRGKVISDPKEAERAVLAFLSPRDKRGGI